jgi:hypothetical protein
MSPSRPLLALVGGALALAVASAGGTAYLTLRTGPLAERLVREVDAVARARYPRPSHVTPARPGRFAEHLEPLMGEVLRLYRERPEALRSAAAGWPCLAVTEGRAPVSELPPPCREAVERGWEGVARVLAATHAEEGGLPEGLGPLVAPSHPYASDGLLALLHLVRLAGLEARLRLARGRAEEAVDLCLDALALSRELAAGGGLVGHMVSASGSETLYRPCAAALDAASLARKRSAVTQLARLAEGLVPFSQTMREESAVMQLMVFGELLSAEQLAALPPGARAVATRTSGLLAHTSNPLDVRLAWRKTVKVYDALVPVVDLGPEARRRAFSAIDARASGELYPAQGPEAEAYARFAERVEVLRLQHDALQALVEVDLRRAETGRWPESPPHRAVHSFVLESSQPGEALLKPCAAQLQEHALRVTADVPAGGWVQAP